jgi:hypothetical protein
MARSFKKIDDNPSAKETYNNKSMYYDSNPDEKTGGNSFAR